MLLEIPPKVLEYIEREKFVTVEDIMERFGFKRATAYNYLSRLKKKGVISRMGYGKYRVGKYEPITVAMVQRANQIVSVVQERMPFAEFAIWSTENLAPFSHYAIGRDVVFIEADKRSSKKIREVLLENNIRCLLEPSRGELGDVFSLLEEPLVIFQRKEAYATVLQDRVRLPLLERMLVDLYFYITRLGFPYPPDEYGRLLYNVLKSKTLNIDMLRKYASRRSVKEEISLILSRMKRKHPELDISDIRGEAHEAAAMVDEIVGGASP